MSDFAAEPSSRASSTPDDRLTLVDAFEAQVHRHKDHVYGFARYLLRSPAEAEDVTQDVLLRFWEHFDRLDEARARGWLLRVTRNACIDVLRKRRRTRDVMTVDTEGVQRAATRRPSPQDEAEGSDVRTHVEEALRQLDEPYRSIVTLREIHHLQYQEICEALDLPMNTVKVYLHRARKRLRHALAEVTDHELA